MPVQPTYPGVYIEEIPSGVRTITGVSTSIAAFIDYFKRGPMNKAVQIFNFGDFEREFGGLDTLSEASYAIQQFFLNGGTQAYVVRVASGSPLTSSVEISDVTTGGSAVLVVNAIHEGTWGDAMNVIIDHDTPVENEFNMTITEYAPTGAALRQERFINLSMDQNASNFVVKKINDEFAGSKMVKVNPPSGNNPPAANGTASGDHRGFGETNETATITISAPNPELDISIDITTETIALSLPDTSTGGSYSLAVIAVALENAIRSAAPSNKQFSGAKVEAIHGRLFVRAGREDARSLISFAPSAADATTVAELLFDGTGSDFSNNVQEYTMDGAGALAAQTGGSGGNDGGIPDAAAINGVLNMKSGIYALEDVDLFNILCIPRTGTDTGSLFDAVHSTAITYSEGRRAFYIIDTPEGIDDLQEIKNWRAGKGNIIRSKNAALYYPRVMIPDPLDSFRLRSVGACGTVAGLYARTDSNRGVWKAPAGTEAALRNVSKLTDVLSDQENGVLNPLGINSLRNFPVYGTVSWGARTMEGADALASEWKYVPVRRLALFLEESLYRGSQWVVFEPNDEPLWSQIRLNFGAFMNNLFKQGAFQGTTPREAYLVKCDRETTTQNDINLGIVNILVGFAPLKPAEFVIIKIQQLAGQVQS